MLDKAFTVEEIRQALFQMHPCKAPGPDGLNAGFFQKYWHITDDSLIFARSSVNDCRQFKRIFEKYSKASGQMFNLKKSSMLHCPNVQGDVSTKLKEVFQLEALSHHEKYLSLPSMLGKSKYQYFSKLKEKVCNKLHCWKSRLFSSGGKEVLIKAVAQAIPTYAMSVFKLPSTLCDDIQKVIAKFWWGSNVKARSIHWMDWKKMCVSKKDGGLGFRDLGAFNQALLGKQCWRLIHCPELLMSRLLRARYFPRGEFMKNKLGSNPSYIWRSLLWGREVIENGSIGG